MAINKKYRIANSFDFPEILAANIGNFGETIDRDLLPRLIEEERVYCAEIDDQIVALLYWQVEFLGLPDAWFIMQITTKLEWRRKNVATSLLKAFLDYAKGMQIKKVFADVRHNNIAAQNFFIKLGAAKSGFFSGIDDEILDDNWVLFRFDLARQ